MKIINQTRNTILAEDVIIAKSLFARMRGLLGRKEFSVGQAIVLDPCNSIHTLFMQFPIDALFMDKDNKVVGIIYSLKPFRISKIYFSARYCIELPAGTIQKNPAQIGNTVSPV